MNILLCSVGRRARLLQDLKKTLEGRGKLVATDNSNTAPALYFADKNYVVPKITDSDYLDVILDICKRENIQAITTFIDPEIEILSKNRELFLSNGVLPLCPSAKTAFLCFDKYEMFKYLKEKNINTVLTYDSLEDFKEALKKENINFPVFIKPKCGSGSVGATKIENIEELETVIAENSHDYIIQEFMDGEDLDADVYIDCITNKPVSIFSKRKIETRIGGASKTISFKDEKLFSFIRKVLKEFEFFGPIDMDFFYKNGEYYLSEINPRFGGAYLHAHGAGINFVKLIENNLLNKANEEKIGDYDEDIIMMMYDDVVIKRKSDLAREF
ncbi:carbamoyl phosphate synthase [Capnocytophaga stomatis]|uniref:Carbamoyl phosphate synthase n=1 Tax=Capnocytophaga stomatis TaxID=1848904 RepID=A0A250FVC7_9FLAO|nr:ATP-grasp domain-containing protein [Capnocytophaga stomatis]ATA89112.1 carbamoyl phosphate synthase [Capnocytophaga stomatis]